MFALLSGLSGYTNIIKYGFIILAVSVIGYKVYSFYSEYIELREAKVELTGKLAKANEELKDISKIANDNATLLDEEKKAHENVVIELNNNHKIELENNKKYIYIRERIKNEEDGILSPVLRNTIDRLYGKK